MAQRFRGGLALLGSEVERIVYDLIKSLNWKESVSVDFIHITLATKDELQSLQEIPESTWQNLDNTVFILESIEILDQVAFIPCIWPSGQTWRLQHGLPLQKFHITLTEVNHHQMDKSISAVCDRKNKTFELLQSGSDSKRFLALDSMSHQLMLEQRPDLALTVAVQLCLEIKESIPKAWIRLADAALALNYYKLAMLSLGLALMNPSLTEKWQRYAKQRLLRCASQTEWELLFSEKEIKEIPEPLKEQLFKSWSFEFRQSLSRDPLAAVAASTLVRPSSVALYNQQGVKLPRFFRWIIPFRLAAMSTPRSAQDIQLLYSLGIRHVLTLTEETPLPEEWFTGMRHTFMPVRNYRAPSMHQLDLAMQIMSNLDSDEPVLIHCGAGKGRAGVVIACYLVAHGFAPPSANWSMPAMSGSEAIACLRLIRPGSIETGQQENAVSAYCSMLWKRQSLLALQHAEPLPSEPEIYGSSIQGTDLLMLIGLPGSGKSWFRQAMCSRSPHWRYVCGDEMGRQECETVTGTKSQQPLIIDRCNGIQKDRIYLLQLASVWSKLVTAVWFDYESDLCLSRSQQRLNHPTLKTGQALNAVLQHSKQFEAPTLAEGFQTLVRLTSFEAVRKFIHGLTGPVEFYKFPRTPHLLNLGAVTEDDLVENHSAISTTSHQDCTIFITEKVDGANLGIQLSFDRKLIVQNRNHHVHSKSHPQFAKLNHWLELHSASLMKLLDRDATFPERFILFGEWLVAKHSIHYTSLPGPFLAFDYYDRLTKTFADRTTLENWLRETSIPLTPVLWSGTTLPNDESLKNMVQSRSKYYNGPMEGVYVKWECQGKVKYRAKVVRGDFIPGNENWSRGAPVLNEFLEP